MGRERRKPAAPQGGGAAQEKGEAPRDAQGLQGRSDGERTGGEQAGGQPEAPLPQTGARIDREEFEYLCRLLCRPQEIRGHFHVTRGELEDFCRQIYGKGAEEVVEEYGMDGLIAIRKGQLELAGKNATMASFLGKVYLAQRDKPQMEEGAAQDTNDQILAIADLINHPARARLLEEMEETEGEDDG